MNRQLVAEHLLAKYPSARIAYHQSPRGRWNYATVSNCDKELAYNHRDVLPNEVVFDIDAKCESEARETFKELVFSLEKRGIMFSVWQTNQEGCGLHIHTFWQDLDKKGEIELMKRIIFKWIAEGISNLDTQLLGKHMVRMEYGAYEKAYPKELFKCPLKADNHFYENTIPEKLLAEYAETVLSYAVKTYSPPRFRFGEMPLCMKHILSPEFKNHKDGAKRALFVVASYFRNSPDDDLLKMLTDFNNYNLREKLDNHKLKQTIRSVRDHKGRPCACRYRHELLRSIGAGKVAEECEAEVQ